MNVQRREFLAAGCGAGLLSLGEHAVMAQKSADTGVLPRTKAEIPTPALLVDLDLFEANLKTMAEHCRQAGREFRPHAKTHKCPEIARRQVQSGAVGICVATVPEAEAMVAAGIPGVLLTSPIVEPAKIARMVALIRRGSEVMLSVGHPRQVELLAEAAGRRERRMSTCSSTSTSAIAARASFPGSLPWNWRSKSRGTNACVFAACRPTPARLARRGLRGSPRTLARGRWPRPSRRASCLNKAGFDAAILSGGSTGTYNIDSAIDGVTELQVGSYVFMDVDYRRIGGAERRRLHRLSAQPHRAGHRRQRHARRPRHDRRRHQGPRHHDGRIRRSRRMATV